MDTTDASGPEGPAGAGVRSVLVTTDADAVAVPGRMAIMVGDPADALVRSAAEEMAAELFSRP
jgi:hypothetical protein